MVIMASEHQQQPVFLRASVSSKIFFFFFQIEKRAEKETKLKGAGGRGLINFEHLPDLHLHSYFNESNGLQIP